MTVVIRFAEARDMALLEDVENSADVVLVDYLKATDWEYAPSGESRAAMAGFLLVAVGSSEDVVVGFVHVLEVDGVAHLEQLSVRPENGQRGIGRELVEAAKHEVTKRGYKYLTLRTFVDVPWNAPFYSKCGFSATEPESQFQRTLLDTENRLRLERYGRRVQMTATLGR